MEQQFSVSWREFQGNLSSGCSHLLTSGEFSDVTLAMEGKLLKAHRLVLSICSPFFQRMFHANPCQHPIVVLKDISYNAMRDLLQFMYNGEVSVKQEDLTNLISTAETLEIKGLTNKLNNQENNNDISPNMQRKNSTSFYNSNCTDLSPYKIIDDDIHSSNQQQIEILNEISKLASIKRKSDSLLNKDYNDSHNILPEKRLKLREKHVLNRHKITLSSKNITNKFFNVRSKSDSFSDTNQYYLKENLNQNKSTEDLVKATSQQDINQNGNSESNGELITQVKKENDIENDSAFEENNLKNNEVRNDINDFSVDNQNQLTSSPRTEQDKLLGSLPSASPPPSKIHILKFCQKEQGKTKRRRCKYCWDTKHIRKDSIYCCDICPDKYGFCLDPCFKLYHGY